MRHKLNKRKLSRDASARKAMLKNLSTSLLDHDRIVTTEARAKETRRVVEKLITKAKGNTLHARRQVLQFITKKETVDRLFHHIIPHFASREGGYTRIIKLGPRKGDAAPLVAIELMDLKKEAKVIEPASVPKD